LFRSATRFCLNANIVGLSPCIPFTRSFQFLCLVWISFTMLCAFNLYLTSAFLRRPNFVYSCNGLRIASMLGYTKLQNLNWFQFPAPRPPPQQINIIIKYVTVLQVAWLLLVLILHSESRVLVKRSFKDQSVKGYLTEVIRPCTSYSIQQTVEFVLPASFVLASFRRGLSARSAECCRPK
jgi:hypothetical protein